MICPLCHEWLESPSYRDSVCLCKDTKEQSVAKNWKRFLQVVLNSVTVADRYMIPMPNGKDPYLERIVLDRKDDGSATYLHLLWEADGDRDPHDHPFDFTSRIIFGGYDELVYSRVCGANHIWDNHETPTPEKCGCGAPVRAVELHKNVFRTNESNTKVASTLHRITKLHAVPTVTLVTRGPKVREWGFQTDDGWMHNVKYIQEKFPNAQPTEVD